MHVASRGEGDAWLSAARPGYCGKTDDGVLGDCDIGDKGSFPGLHFGSGRAAASKRSVARQCLHQCAKCARCAYITLSVQFKDCSWFSECDLSRLRTDIPSFLSGAVAKPAGGGAGQTLRYERRRSMAARRALQLRAEPWPWYQPHAAARVAVVLYGKVGTLLVPSSWTAADAGDERVVRLAAASYKGMIARANPRATHGVFASSSSSLR